jgi:glycosyltransferase involved in cell wall biosynthesis
VGRFTAVKRLDRLIAAFARARPRFARPAGLVLVGGHPGEWEGEHPARVAGRLGVPDVFLAGWRGHDELPSFLSAADAVVMSSEREQFGLVLIEGMACGLPAVATRSLGPATIVEDGRTGWLVELGDQTALEAALTAVVDDPRERAPRYGRASPGPTSRPSSCSWWRRWTPRRAARARSGLSGDDARDCPASPQPEEPRAWRKGAYPDASR